LFEALDVWSKIQDGRLSSTPIQRARVPSWAHPGGTSDIVRHVNGAGFQVATTHRIQMPDGSIPHWHAKDIHIGDIVIWSQEP